MITWFRRWLMLRRWKRRLKTVNNMFWSIEHYPELARSWFQIRDKLSEMDRSEYLSNRR